MNISETSWPIATKFYLDSVHTWCLENGMLINTDKTKLMLIASRQIRNSLIDSDLKITFNNIDLKTSTNEKILGVHVRGSFKKFPDWADI